RPGAVVVGVQGDADLLEVVLALGAGGGFADLLDGGQQQADQDGDDGDHDQQFDEGEGSAAPHGRSPFGSRRGVGPVPQPGRPRSEGKKGQFTSKLNLFGPSALTSAVRIVWALYLGWIRSLYTGPGAPGGASGSTAFFGSADETATLYRPGSRPWF